MSLESKRPRMLLNDPVAIRALAHPIRLELQSMLGRLGPMTAAEAARRVGISQALASHHLRQLAKYGFVESAPGKDNRERPWRTASTSQSWLEAIRTDEGAAAASVLEQVIAENAVARLIDWQDKRRTEEPAWRDNTGIGNTTVYLTVEEYTALNGQIEAMLQRYVDERPIDDPSTRPPGSRAVTFTHIVTVLPEEDES